MDRVEIARHIAADLHRQAVANGYDPWRPYEFAVSEAKRRGFDVESAITGAAMLNGARATVISSDRLILHENAGTPFEQAYLIAHEIGHIELGDDDGVGPAIDIDFARAAESVPIGADRIVDYGRRQRREVQMDMFAREFLLPRSVVRQLHLEGKATATEIAARLGAPFALVAQQLLDALLLPQIGESEANQDRGSVEHSLNPEQLQAACHRGGAYLLEAGPGTGKTQTLSARVEALLEDGIDPRRILLLTFSNKAAAEMAERIARKSKVAASAMWIGTFHAFGLDIIRRFHAELGLPNDPRMLDRTEAVELLEAAFTRLRLTHYRNFYDPTQIVVDLLTAISRAKDEVVDEARYAELAEAMRRTSASDQEREAAEKAGEVAAVYAAYEQLKRQAQCIDYGDLITLPVRLLEGDAAIRTHFQAQYGHVLVDEYQDVNRGCIRLLAALCGDGRTLWAVGDAKQSIYRFRGASSFNMRRFGQEDFRGGTRGRLKLNYRSVEEVVKTFSTFALRMKAGDENSGLDTDRGASGILPELRTVEQAPQQTIAIADAIQEMRQAGYRYRDQLVLCTGNEKLAETARDLELLGIPVLYLGSLFERPEIKDLLSLLSILTDYFAAGLIRVACMEEFAMSIEDVATICYRLRSIVSPRPTPAAWLHTASAFENISHTGREAVEHLAKALNGFDETTPAWDVLATLLLDRTRIAARIGSSNEVAQQNRGLAIWQFMNFVRAQPSGQGLSITRLLNRVRRLLRFGDDRDLRHLPAAARGIDAVSLMTIHGAKGLEFPIVHIPGLNEDTISRTPSSPQCLPPDGMVEGIEGRTIDGLRAGQIEEQECLFYVALSRARDRLFAYAPLKKLNGQRRPLSAFIDRLGPTLTHKHVTIERSLPPTPEASPIPLAVHGPLRFSGSQLALYERCPRRFFYTHIFRAGGRRAETPYMKIHEAVRAIVQDVVAGTYTINTEDELMSKIVAAFATSDLANHGYADDYKAIAANMVRYLLSIRQGYTPVATAALSIELGGPDRDVVTVHPDDMLLLTDGTQTLLRIMTGHFRSYEEDDVGAAAFVLAAHESFPGAATELVHLSDQTKRKLDLSAKQLENRRSKMTDMLKQVRVGSFPPEPSARTCPACPAFFICGPTPSGVLRPNWG